MMEQHAIVPKPPQFISTNAAGREKMNPVHKTTVFLSRISKYTITKNGWTKMRAWRAANYQPMHGSGLKGETGMEE